ncbi:MAG: threonylcarbamoyl-AMP synthase [Ruminococcaceae bacterium]|nr:threonylcarbamoyl-AMP synthase [Oscillospiraceae bacterium]
MKTKVITQENIHEAAKCLADGGTVVFPTETVYGLGADAFNDDAVSKIFEAKGRPGDNPLIVHISHVSQLSRLAKNVSPRAKLLIEKFWPGPLTLILPKCDSVSSRVTAGLETVAVRFPSNPIAQNLISLSGTLVAAPSANLSGSPSPTVCADVVDDLDGRVDYIIDGTGCEIGLESTVVDVSTGKTVVLRPGGVTLEMIKELIPDAELDKGLIDADSVPKCPGLKYTHYSPKADVIVVQGEKKNVRAYIGSMLSQNSDCGVLTYGGGTYDGAKLVLDAGADMTSYAHNLFSHLRTFDKHGVCTVYAEFNPENGMGTAVRNRLYKAAGHKIVEV